MSISRAKGLNNDILMAKQKKQDILLIVVIFKSTAVQYNSRFTFMFEQTDYTRNESYDHREYVVGRKWTSEPEID